MKQFLKLIYAIMISSYSIAKEETKCWFPVTQIPSGDFKQVYDGEKFQRVSEIFTHPKWYYLSDATFVYYIANGELGLKNESSYYIPPMVYYRGRMLEKKSDEDYTTLLVDRIFIQMPCIATDTLPEIDRSQISRPFKEGVEIVSPHHFDLIDETLKKRHPIKYKNYKRTDYFHIADLFTEEELQKICHFVTDKTLKDSNKIPFVAMYPVVNIDIEKKNITLLVHYEQQIIVKPIFLSKEDELAFFSPENGKTISDNALRKMPPKVFIIGKCSTRNSNDTITIQVNSWFKEEALENETKESAVQKNPGAYSMNIRKLIEYLSNKLSS